jgi:hypothetical protein
VANLVDALFGIVGLLTLVVYAMLIVTGTRPEQALLLAIGGGIVMGLLLRTLLAIVSVAVEGDDDNGADHADGLKTDEVPARGGVTGRSRTSGVDRVPADAQRGSAGMQFPESA